MCIKQGDYVDSAGKKANGDAAVPWRLPPDVLETLEVFVMEPAQLAGEHAALDALDGSANGTPPAAASPGVPGSLTAGGTTAPAKTQLSEGALLMQLVEAWACVSCRRVMYSVACI